jgi:hypothetical protein
VIQGFLDLVEPIQKEHSVSENLSVSILKEKRVERH